jgi:hypothetical protein
MRLKLLVLSFILFSFSRVPLFTQTHLSVPLENQVYYILEQAQLRGLCAHPHGVGPYTRRVILNAVNDILYGENANKLGSAEMDILERYLEKFASQNTGFDPQKGIYRGETFIGKNDTLISANLGGGLDIEGTSGFYFSEYYFGTEVWARLFVNGDLGGNVSWGVHGEGGFFQAPRKFLGEYNTYYDGFENDPYGQYVNNTFDVYSEPMSHFPYTYKKRWDGSVHHIEELTGFNSWPDSSSFGYNILSELSASFLEDKLIFRIGRITHDWGSPSLGRSLVLNQMARPFLGIEADFNPFSWLGFSTMTGFLEFFNRESEKVSGMTFQNAYSITMLQLKYKNYFFLDIGETIVWPKRFEFGYIFPLTPSIIYQGNIGDFDNMGFFFNIKGQYPGLGNIWFSFFLDEAVLVSNMNELDRTMFAWQAGMSFPLSVLSFSSIKISYTKVNPYCYTHNRNFNPWYGNIPMETSYTNNGVSLGYYIPPNSDELLIKFQTMPAKNVSMSLQYQLIRHGADFGSSAVDGSSLLSELDPNGREGSKNVLRRFFLEDGAYQWINILKIGMEWNLPNMPIAFYGEAGMNYSYFTNIGADANVTGRPYSYSIINTDEYPKTTGFVVKLGVRIFPR